VSSIEDGENAEAVASAVPGVTEVADETELA
jgi:osmotically-inducible protein OsmY